MKKIEIFLITLIILLALALRLYKINRPIADWHSWRQADTAAVARNFIKEGYNPFIPKYDDMSSQTNGRANPSRYRFVEFPIYNSIIYAVWLVTGVSTTSARLVTVVITLISTILLYFLVRYFSGWQTAALTSFFFATLPYNIFYSSAILPGPLMVFFLLALYLCFIKWLHNQKIAFLVLSIIFANLAILTWPIALFFMLPLVYLALQKFGTTFLKKPSLWIFAAVSLTPFLIWRIWMTRFPEGIPSWQFLLNDANIRFKGAFFRWLIAERLGKLIVTVGGFSLFIIGLLTKTSKKEGLFYFFWLLSAVLYFVVFASGNVRHDYYQVPAVPILVIFMAKGVFTLFDPKNLNINKNLARVVAILLVLTTYAFGIYEVRGYFWINNPQIIEAGQAADKILPKDATVIAPYGGDTAFLYQTNRYGYPIVDRSLEKFVEQGTKYLVSVDLNDAGIKNLSQNCKVIERTDNYVIIEMFKECLGK